VHNAQEVNQMLKPIFVVPAYRREIFDHSIAFVTPGCVGKRSQTTVGGNKIQMRAIIARLIGLLGVNDGVIYVGNFNEILVQSHKHVIVDTS
jgi:hypothetical protein